jgi:tryptophan synthase alpha chain
MRPMMNRITNTFEELTGRGRKVFIPFITAGDPDLATTVRLVPSLEEAGSHIVELGIPFSDPVADGPVIQRSSERALRHGYRLADYLEAVASIRKRTGVPLVIFSYLNPLLQYGLEAFARDARAAGVDGVLATDMIPEESGEYCPVFERHQLDTIFLVAPTSSSSRVKKICDRCHGFVYLISRTGVTGARGQLSDSILPTLRRVREQSRLPVAVGFGISSPEQVRAVWEVAEGAVVGSAIVALMEEHGGCRDLIERVARFCRWLTEGNDA